MTLDALVRQVVREELERLLEEGRASKRKVVVSDLGRARARAALARLGIAPPKKAQP